MTPTIPRGTEIAAADTRLLRRLGVETLPAHETRYLPLDRLIVPGAVQIARNVHRLVKSITQVGLLQAPAVMLCTGRDIHDPEATFEVIAGRRRVLAARLAGLEVAKCEVYEASTPQLASLITLIENEQRSSAWVKEVEALRRLLDEKVGMTPDDLAAFGFDRASLAERLKVAQLPAPLIERVLAGSLNRETARRLIRLTKPQQEQIADLAERGEEITVDVVKHALRAQIDAGFAPMQEQLAQVWQVPPPAPSAAPSYPAPVPSPEGNTVHAAVASAPASALAQLVADLHRFEQSCEYPSVPPAVRSLTAALIQQAQICLRTARSHDQ